MSAELIEITAVVFESPPAALPVLCRHVEDRLPDLTVIQMT